MHRHPLRVLALGSSVVLVAAVLVAGTSTPAVACSCIAQEPAEILERADVVFVGTPVHQKQFGGDLGGYITRFTVDRVFKGDVGATQRVVTSAQTGGGCGMTFESTSPVVVAADRGLRAALLPREVTKGLDTTTRRRVRNSPSTNICLSAGLPEAEEAAQAFGAGRPPR